MLKKILIGLLFVFIFLQFIRPTRNISDVSSSNHFSTKYNIPENVETILQKACYDCHSNNTTYPWYTNVQPVGLWMQGHVNDGKDELNFSEFATYSPKKARHKMEECVDMIKEGEMPLPSYTWTHKDAILTQEEKTTLTDWASATAKKIEIDNKPGPEKKR
jgi:hypothetical protein